MFHTSTIKKTILYRLFSAPVKISEKSALDLRRLTHAIELDILFKSLIHYPVSSSFILFGIITYIITFLHYYNYFL